MVAEFAAVTSQEERPGETKVWRNPYGKEGELLCSFDDNIKTLYESFQASVKNFGNLSVHNSDFLSVTGKQPYLGSRTIVGDIALNYKFETYEAVAARTRNFAYQ